MKDVNPEQWMWPSEALPNLQMLPFLQAKFAAFEMETLIPILNISVTARTGEDLHGDDPHIFGLLYLREGIAF